MAVGTVGSGTSHLRQQRKLQGAAHGVLRARERRSVAGTASVRLAPRRAATGRTRDGFEWQHAVGWAATRMEGAVGTIGSGASHLRQQRKANHAMGGSLRACT